MSIEAIRNELTGALIGLAKTCSNHKPLPTTMPTVREALVNLKTDDEAILKKQLENIRVEKFNLSPGCATCAVRCGNTDDFDLKKLDEEPKDLKAKKKQLLSMTQRLAAVPHLPYWKKGENFESSFDFLILKGLAFIEFADSEKVVEVLCDEIEKAIPSDLQ